MQEKDDLHLEPEQNIIKLEIDRHVTKSKPKSADKRKEEAKDADRSNY